jgi:cytochrome c oxidase assembly factor CtaG
VRCRRQHEGVTRWSFDPLTVAALVVAAIAYRRADQAVAAAHPRHLVPAGRRRAFYAGLTVVAVAILSPVHAYADERFVVHMAQHLLLTLVAAPLLVIGAPLTLAVRAASPEHRRQLLRALNGPVVTCLGHPVVAWAQFAVVMWATHFSGFFESALESAWVHALEHGLFLGSAALFWWPALGESTGRWRLSHPLRLLYVALAMPQNTFLALAILSAGRVLYPHYGSRADQRQAGGVMWVAGDLALLVVVLLLTAAWARQEERTTRRRERLEDERAVSRAAADRPPSPRTAASGS